MQLQLKQPICFLDLETTGINVSLDKIVEIARKKMAENPQMTDEMIEQALGMTKKFLFPFAIGGAIIGTAIMGVIASLIGAGIAKKNPVDPFSEPTA